MQFLISTLSSDFILGVVRLGVWWLHPEQVTSSSQGSEKDIHQSHTPRDTCIGLYRIYGIDSPQIQGKVKNRANRLQLMILL